MNTDIAMTNINQLLYTDESGEVVGLDEVQLIDPPLQDRIPKLRQLLQVQDLYIVFQSAILLAAWGDLEGLAKIEEMIDEPVHKMQKLVPHRLYGYDNIYDELSYAVYLFGFSGQKSEDTKRLFSKLLKLYGDIEFESKLKFSLLRCEFFDLASEVEEAIKRSLSLERYYLASQMLPVLAKWNPEVAWSMVDKFICESNRQTPNPLANVAEALGYINNPSSRSLLKKLLEHPEVSVTEEAERSLVKLSQTDFSNTATANSPNS
ncbi:hypothetical protein [Microcoleus sp. B7-D4]|uniref:hypothetical protein n=1 Tax=Microcoleus sp. B7-D4 TaxID=2818696 RepID=UPI002FD78CB2